MCSVLVCGDCGRKTMANDSDWVILKRAQSSFLYCSCRSPSIEYYSGVDFPDSWDHKVLPPNRPSFNFSNFVCNLALVSTFCLSVCIFVCLPFSRSHFLWHLWLLRPQTASATAHQTTSFQRPQFSNFVCMQCFYTFVYVYFLDVLVFAPFLCL